MISTKRTTPESSHTAVAYMADSQSSALGTGCHLGSETSVGLPGGVTFFYACFGQPPCSTNFQLTDLTGLNYGLGLGFWVVVTIIIFITLTITLITTLTVILTLIEVKVSKKTCFYLGRLK